MLFEMMLIIVADLRPEIEEDTIRRRFNAHCGLPTSLPIIVMCYQYLYNIFGGHYGIRTGLGPKLTKY